MTGNLKGVFTGYSSEAEFSRLYSPETLTAPIEITIG